MDAGAISNILQAYLMQDLTNQDGISNSSSSVSFENVLNNAMQEYSSQSEDNGDLKEMLSKLLPLYIMQGLSSGGSDGLSSGDSASSILFENLLKNSINENYSQYSDSDSEEMLSKLLPLYVMQGLTSDGSDGLSSGDSTSSILFENILKSSIKGYNSQYSYDDVNTAIKNYVNSNSSNNNSLDNTLSGSIEDAIEKVSQKYGVDPDFIKAIIKQESGFNSNAVSKAGAMGLMQLMPKTAESLGVNNPFNVLENLDGGVRYIKKLMESFSGNPELALAAYNGGSGRMRKLGVDTTGEIQLMPKETRNYVQKVMSNYEKYKKL